MSNKILDNFLPIYLDCNATTPVDQRVIDIMRLFLEKDFGNPASRTHEYGVRAKRSVDNARSQLASVIDADPTLVTFTSGATESNNLAILGLARYGEMSGKKHIISTAIEHKSVLEPLSYLEKKGFAVTYLRPGLSGAVQADQIESSLRENTLLLSVMHVNNETGIIQPIDSIAQALKNREVYFHVDAAQGFCKETKNLKNKRIDMISISSHKICGPKGIGALVTRKRNQNRVPLQPIMFGGGHENGLRPGTLPAHLIAGFGLAAELAWQEADTRRDYCKRIKMAMINTLKPLNPVYNGDQSIALDNAVSVSFPGLDSEAVIITLKNLAALSNGSACTSQSYEQSHVLKAMGVPSDIIDGTVRFSWCYLTPPPDWAKIADGIKSLY